MEHDEIRTSLAELRELCIAAALGVGASSEAAHSLAAATIAAEADGQTTVGLSHFFDYLDAFDAGRIKGNAIPVVSHPAPALVAVDADRGLAHLAADLGHDLMIAAARRLGLSVLAIGNAYTCGSLGYFAGRVAEVGLVALAATNGPPMLAGSGSRGAVFGTNPLAFAAPAGEETLLIDQASSATAYVNVRRAAERGRHLPAGWAIDEAGVPTTDPAAAMAGALLAFGGTRGANIALMVEVLAAGLTGAHWSLDAPSFSEGASCPGVGLLMVALDPSLLDPGFQGRLAAHMTRLEERGVHIPGRSRKHRRAAAWSNGVVIPRALHDRLQIASSSPNSAHVSR